MLGCRYGDYMDEAVNLDNQNNQIISNHPIIYPTWDIYNSALRYRRV